MESAILYSVLLCEERELQSYLSKYMDFGTNSMNKTRGRRKMFITRAYKASWISSCLAPMLSSLSSPCFGVKLVYNYGPRYVRLVEEEWLIEDDAKNRNVLKVTCERNLR